MGTLKDIAAKIAIVLVLAGFVVIAMKSCKGGDVLFNTPVSIKSIEKIGELICSEYYGEVIESLQSVKNENNSIAYRSFYSTIYNLLDEHKSNLDKEWSSNKKIRRSTEWFCDTHQELCNRLIFKQLMHVSNNKSVNDFIRYELWNKDWETFASDYKKKLDKLRKKDIGKAEIVYIGRGRVKAGFDLKNYDYSQLDTLGDTLIFNNLDPIILDADINPWFVSSEVKGFEIIKIQKEKDISFSDITLVKTRCKEKLQQQALEREILVNAIESGEETLEGFYNLLTLVKNKQIKKVIILPTPLFLLKKKIVADNTINSSEIVRLKHAIIENSDKDNKQLLDVVDEIHLATLGNYLNADNWPEEYNSLKELISGFSD